MKIVTLVENTSNFKNIRKQHGLSFYIETKNHKILFDVGPDDTFLKNANELGISIKDVDIVIISHGHVDHGGGLKTFLNENKTAKIYIRNNAFREYIIKLLFLNINISLDFELQKLHNIVLVNEVHKIDDELILISNSSNKFDKPKNKGLYVKVNEEKKVDDFSHEQALIIKSEKGNTILTGCSHSGVLNFKQTAEEIISEKISHIIGGFHTASPITKRIENKKYLENLFRDLLKSNSKYYTCHCTGKKAYKFLKEKMNDKIDYLSSGSIIEL